MLCYDSLLRKTSFKCGIMWNKRISGLFVGLLYFSSLWSDSSFLVSSFLPLEFLDGICVEGWRKLLFIFGFSHTQTFWPWDSFLPKSGWKLRKKKVTKQTFFFFFSSLQRKVTLKKSKLYLGYCSCLLAASGFSKCVSCLESRRVGRWGYQMPYAGSHKAKREKKKKVRKNKIFHRKLKLWGKWNFHHEKVLSRNVTVLRTTYESHFWSPLCGFSSLLSSSRLLLDERTFPKYGPDGTYILVYFYIISTSLSGDWGPRIHLFASPHCLIHGLLWSICKVTGPSPFKTLGRSISALTCRRNQPYGYG